MGKKQMYNSECIYFGSLTYNAWPQGYYTQAFDSYEQVPGKDGKLSYRKLDGSTTLYQEFCEGTHEYLTVSNITPMIEVMPEEKRGQLVSKKMIYFYLVKHRINVSKQNAKTKKYVKVNQFPQNDNK